jgi:hypothetical protein
MHQDSTTALHSVGGMLCCEEKQLGSIGDDETALNLPRYQLPSVEMPQKTQFGGSH